MIEDIDIIEPLTMVSKGTVKFLTNLLVIKLFGTIAIDFGGRELPIEILHENMSLKDILHLLKERFFIYFPNYFDEDYSPKRGTLILINGVDFNTLDGLQTIVTSKDQISFIPTISGG